MSLNARAQSLLAISAAVAAGVVWAQDPIVTLPKNYRLLFENAAVRVEHVTYGPHEKLPVHDHPGSPTVYVCLTDSKPVRFTHIEAKAFTSTRPAETAGTFRVSPGRVEKHEVENTGDLPAEFLRVELRQIPLGFQSAAFRSPKVFNRTRRGATVEFSSPQFQIRRVVAVGSQATEVAGTGLFVALTVVKIGQRELKPGEVLWADAGSRSKVFAAGTAANLLFISF